MCINYHNLNFKTIKNRYFLLLIKNMLNRLTEARIFIRLNMKHVYYQLHIYKNNKWKTAFHISLKLFKYMIVLFDFMNTSAVF